MVGRKLVNVPQRDFGESMLVFDQPQLFVRKVPQQVQVEVTHLGFQAFSGGVSKSGIWHSDEPARFVLFSC